MSEDVESGSSLLLRDVSAVTQNQTHDVEVMPSQVEQKPSSPTQSGATFERQDFTTAEGKRLFVTECSLLLFFQFRCPSSSSMRHRRTSIRCAGPNLTYANAVNVYSNAQLKMEQPNARS